MQTLVSTRAIQFLQKHNHEYIQIASYKNVSSKNVNSLVYMRIDI
jgi:hypothetical protein